MNDNAVIEPIPWEAADQLCAAIRKEAEQNWHMAAARWCWNCQEETGGDMNNRGFMRESGNRGCYLVNARFAESRFVD
jgi:hypothetical protein